VLPAFFTATLYHLNLSKQFVMFVNTSFYKHCPSLKFIIGLSFYFLLPHAFLCGSGNSYNHFPNLIFLNSTFLF
jgi:hypothetical protein